ncbi:MAG: nitroreductase family protein [Flavobacteriales bacterium]|nr:nitroreductase family protein [Flavobacteriales bacterium]
MVKVKMFDASDALKARKVAVEMPPINSKEFYDVVDSRRSVRIYADDPVPEEVMRRAMEAALKAPTSSNLQVWEIHWVRSDDKKKALIKACLGQPAAATAQELVVFVARPDLWKRNNGWMIRHLESNSEAPGKAIQYFKKITKIVYNQGPLGVFRPFKWLWFTVRGFRKPTPREPIHKGHMDTWAHKTTALAAQTFMLAVRAEGFDSCPMEGLDSKRVKRLLGLPRGAGINMAISVGKRAEGGVYGPRFRFDAKHFIIEQ